MRRFLLHVLPGGFHRIRHYGLLANGHLLNNLALARELLHVTPLPPDVWAGRSVGRAGADLRARALRPRDGGAASLLAQLLE